MTARSSFSLTFSQILFFLFSAASLLAVGVSGGVPALMVHAIYAGTLAACLLAGLALGFAAQKTRTRGLYALIFVLALAYASCRNAPFPYRRGELTDISVKVLTERRVRRDALEFAARIKGVHEGRHTGETGILPGGVPLFGDKVLLRVPPTRHSIRRGDTIRVRGLFTDLPYERSKEYALFLHNSGFNAVFEGYGGGLTVEKRQRASSPLAIAHELHLYVRSVNERLLPWPQSEFAVSLFTGNRDDLPEELVKAFIASGTMHLLAVSGLHFGFFALFFLSLFRLFRLRSEAVYLLLAAVTVFYMIFIGDAPSVQRSAVMVLCGIAVFLFDRDRNYYNILAISYDLLWCLNPLAPFNPGFLLSFSATFSLFFLAPPLTTFLERAMGKREPRGTEGHAQSLPAEPVPGHPQAALPAEPVTGSPREAPPAPAASRNPVVKFLAVSISVSAAVQVYLWPVLLHYFGSFPYINLAANIPLVPLSGLSLGLELATLLVYPFALPLAVVLAEANTVVITLILRLTLLFGSVRPVVVEVFPGFVIPIYFVAATAAIAFFRKRSASEKAASVSGEPAG